MIQFHNSDAIAWARAYKGPLFHALLCDPPYHLTSIVKRYKRIGEGDRKKARSNPFMRTATGFMGHEWDGGDVAFKKSTWKAFKRILYPGAFGIAFSGSRGWHRMAVAIEDAGFIIHPTIFGWAYSSGMPKGHGVDNDEFEGHRYGLQTLKPAVEPILVFQKPYEGPAQKNIISTGAGALNVGDTRIVGEEYAINRYNGLRLFSRGSGRYQVKKARGRVASNFILLDLQAAAALDRQSGILKSGYMPAGTKKRGAKGAAVYGDFKPSKTINSTYGDSGGASRFFFKVQEKIDHADPIYYCSKPGRKEKDAGLDEFPYAVVGGEEQKYKCPHPTVKALALTQYLATLLIPPAAYSPRRLFVPFSGVGSEAIGGMLAGWEDVSGVEMTKEYIPIAEARAEYWRESSRRSRPVRFK